MRGGWPGAPGMMMGEFKDGPSPVMICPPPMVGPPATAPYPVPQSHGAGAECEPRAVNPPPKRLLEQPSNRLLQHPDAHTRLDARAKDAHPFRFMIASSLCFQDDLASRPRAGLGHVLLDHAPRGATGLTT